MDLEICETNNSNNIPRFLDLLNSEDKEDYFLLKESLSNKGSRNRRGKRLEAFSDMLNKVKEYSLKGNENDWKRCMVCGVCWLDSGIAINTRQLRLLIDKCKSSINGSLHRMGYSPTSSGGDTSSSLIEKLPLLKGNFSELRQWTIRQLFVSTPQPISIPNKPLYHTIPFLSPAPSISEPLLSSYNLESKNLIDSNEFDLFDDPFSIPINNWLPESSQQNEFDDFNNDI